MRQYTIRCPKCSHEQRRSAECEKCGIIFERYVQIQKRKKQEAVAAGQKKSKKSSVLVTAVQIVLIIALTSGTTYWFMRPETSEKQPVQQQPQGGSAESRAPAPRPASRPEPDSSSSDKAPARGSSIEMARKATVSIETPWGTGSGFFVNESYIVTNRHVLEVNQEQLEEFRRQVETYREMVELEEEKLTELRNRLRTMQKGPTRSQLQIIIEERERELEKALPQLEEAEERLAAMEQNVQPSDIKIILADGSNHVADYLLMSDNHDLALMSLIANEVHFLKRAPANYQIKQGDKVFTIGSPVGLRNTVTSGVFSGYRQDMEDGRIFLQTDAPINPGNSGGPLIDEKGFVRGVNTMILQNTEGIGFAIPIETVYEEFGGALF